MALFKAYAPEVEVYGRAVYAIVDGLGAFEHYARQVLARHGIVDLRPDGWYSQQAWLDAFAQLSEKLGANALRNVGRKIPLNAVFPENVRTIQDALGAIDVAYHLNHRGGEIGHYRYVPTGPRSAEMVCDTPYPSEFDQGIIEAQAARFLPADSSGVHVRLDLQRPTRRAGAESCTYRVEW